MEHNGYKYLHNMAQLVTTLVSRRNCSTDLIPKNVENSDFLSNLFSKPQREFRKPKFKIGDSVRISKYDLPFRKGYRPQFKKDIFDIVAISSKKNLQHTQKRVNKMRLSAVNFIKKSWSKSFNNGIAYNRVGFKRICSIISRQNTELFYKLFTRATDSGRSMGGCNFRNILPFNIPKSHGGKIYVFLDKNQSRQKSTIWDLIFTLPLRILLKPWTLWFKNDAITAKTVSQFKSLEERKKKRDLVCKWSIWYWILQYGSGTHFRKYCW